MQDPGGVEQLEREEEAARQRLAAAREAQVMDEGEAPSADHALIQKLEAEWKHALERLHLARGHAGD
jgi:hypothetical protein